MSPNKTKSFFEKAKTNFISEKFSISEHDIHYIQTGENDKPTLVFIHGSPGSWDAFKEYLKDSLLLKKYRMIAIDRPGFGYSNFGQAEDLQTQSKRINAFLKTKDNKQPVILIGHSMGGPVITEMTTLAPDKYKTLVIIAGSIDPDAEKPENWRKVIKTKPIRYLIPGAMRPANDELWLLKQDLKDLKPLLKNIKSEILIIHGTKDQLVPYSNVGFIQKEFVNAKSMDLISIKDANHFIPWTHFETIRDALLNIKLE
ncbi:alpha/beta fold hydrolase [Flavobacterium soli]|uniref:alpha/beta fold hydrolase n=1 Tax=Flavobacterium soli TaxID=344881 RepID=UPI0003FA9944|nr:alpha/beta hydrolase [Flavobacterium soli]